MDNTIAAISTPLGTGAISIIRMSGKDSISIINKIFTKDLSNEKSHTIHYGKIIDNNEEIDEVLVSLMRSPKTFTKEDVIEINCHGGLSTTNKVLELLLNNGAVLASPGEFTKRAFLNGRIDLIEAQGIMDLIEAKTELARTQAMKELNGNLSNKIDLLREKLIEIISNIEVNIDYPEYEDINKVTNEQIYPKIKELIQEIDNLIAQRYLGYKHNKEQFYKLEGLSEKRIKEVTDNLNRQIENNKSKVKKEKEYSYDYIKKDELIGIKTFKRNDEENPICWIDKDFGRIEGDKFIVKGNIHINNGYFLIKNYK